MFGRKKIANQIHQEGCQVIVAEGKSKSVWRSYREQIEIYHRNSPLLSALKLAVARFELKQVRHATFEQLSSAGYDVQFIEDGATPLNPVEATRRGLPERWRAPQPVVAPKVATLRNAILFMDGSALLPDGRFNYFDITVPAPGQRWRRLYTRSHRTMRFIGKHSENALIRRKFRSIDVPGRCFSTRSDYSRNFGHFVHDVLSRIYYENLGVIVPGRDKVIAPRMRLPMQEILFRKVFEGYEILHVPPEVPLRVEELLLPGNLCHMNGFNPAAIAALAKRMRQIMVPYAGRERRKVCVSRSDGRLVEPQKRNFVNVDAYEARMRELGYDVVTVSALDPEDQFALWANTTDIVGIHGAGMMNMMMMPSGGNYTEIIAAPLGPGTSIMRCAMAAGHQVGGIAGNAQTVEGGFGQDRLAIDLGRLESMLLDSAREKTI